jgi:hypothetical protein
MPKPLIQFAVQENFRMCIDGLEQEWANIGPRATCGPLRVLLWPAKTVRKICLELRFQDFKKIEPKFNLLTYPITADIDTAPEELQLELIDMRSDHTVKEMFNAVCVTLVDFYKSLLKNFRV